MNEALEYDEVLSKALLNGAYHGLIGLLAGALVYYFASSPSLSGGIDPEAVFLACFMGSIPMIHAFRWLLAFRRLWGRVPPWSAVDMLREQISRLPRATSDPHRNAHRVKSYSKNIFEAPTWKMRLISTFVMTVILIPAVFVPMNHLGYPLDGQSALIALIAILLLSYVLVASRLPWAPKPSHKLICWMDETAFGGRILDPRGMRPGASQPVLTLLRRRYDWQKESHVYGDEADRFPLDVKPSNPGHEFSIPLEALDVPWIHIPLQFDVWSLVVEREMGDKHFREIIQLHPGRHPLASNLLRPSNDTD
jgi:hypothetical protein